MTGVRVDALTLSGPPRNVRAIVALDVGSPDVISVAVSFEKQPSIFLASLRPVTPGKCEIRLQLPDVTPPGSYNGEATLGGKPRPIVVQVESKSRVSIEPEQTLLTVSPASSASFAITVANGGNVPIEIPKAATFDLDDADSQERALGRSLRAPLARGELRAEKFFEELRVSHGGEGRVSVRSGAGPLRAGEERELKCVLDVPDSVAAGRTYTGSWDLGPVSHEIVASIVSSSRPNPVKATP